MGSRKVEKKQFRKVERHDDRTVYIVWYLWLVGFSERNAAAVASISPKQVAGIIARSSYNRSKMSDAERQAELDKLLAVRFNNGVPIDGGALDRAGTKIIPLRRAQRKKRG